MRLELVAAVSAPGGAHRPNDDAYCAGDGFAAVLDGATGLGEPLLDTPSDAAWLAQQGADRLLHHAPFHHGRDLLRTALTEIEARFHAERLRPPQAVYEIPMASMMMVQPVYGPVLEAFWFGDCSALVQRPGEAVEVVGDALGKRTDEVGWAASLAASHGLNPAGNLSRDAFLTPLREHRNRCNGGGGAWVLAPDARCAEHARNFSFTAPARTWLLLATDGFMTLVTDYDRYDGGSLMDAAVTDGLKPLLEELRWVEDADPEGLRYPRFKKSDDATALLLRVS
jgi:hypothetical protein